MNTPSPSTPKKLTDDDLSGAPFVRCTLEGAVMRAVEIDGADIDAPWLLTGDSALLINGVDVVPFVDAELDKRFPGRSERRAADPYGLRAAWAKLENAWAATLDRVSSMPPGIVDVQVAGSGPSLTPCGTW